MSIFRRKQFPALDSADVARLIRSAAIGLDWGAVLELHSIYGPAAPPEALWDWWLDQAEALWVGGNRSVADLAIEFASKANVDPWGPLETRHWERMRRIRAT